MNDQRLCFIVRAFEADASALLPGPRLLPDLQLYMQRTRKYQSMNTFGISPQPATGGDLESGHPGVFPFWYDDPRLLELLRDKPHLHQAVPCLLEHSAVAPCLPTFSILSGVSWDHFPNKLCAFSSSVKAGFRQGDMIHPGLPADRVAGCDHVMCVTPWSQHFRSRCVSFSCSAPSAPMGWKGDKQADPSTEGRLTDSPGRKLPSKQFTCADLVPEPGANLCRFTSVIIAGGSQVGFSGSRCRDGI